jgi:hypothetical protein
VKHFDYATIQNPIYQLPDANVRDPAVLVHDGRAYLFFTLHLPMSAQWYVAMTTTEDFLHFAPMSIISPEGYASPGNVIRHQDRWYLCYQQYHDFPHYLCLSSSTGLVQWSAPAFAFNTGADNTWNRDGRVIDPYLVRWRNRYYCYYTGSTRWLRGPGHNFIGVASSTNLQQWRDLSPAAPVIGVDYDWEGPDGNENNCVFRAEGQWWMLYSASLQQQRIACATSADLLHWAKHGLCDVPFIGCERIIGAPFLIEALSRQGRHYMVYQSENLDGTTAFHLRASRDYRTWR